MKIKLLVIVSLVFLFSCQSNTQESKADNSEQKEKIENQKKLNKQLFISTRTVTGTDENRKDKSVISTIESDYFEVTLSKLSEEPKFIATKKLIKPSSMENFKYVYFNITDEEGENFKFDTSTDFLNFMSERGYNLADQVKNKYGGDYTFKKK
jgi:hypothetical protein